MKFKLFRAHIKKNCFNFTSTSNLSICPWISQNKCSGVVEIMKKDLSHPMEKNPQVSTVESSWYEWWEKNNFFKRSNAKENFVMILPPPNVTGKLHIGHALTCALQDALVRWNQMHGRKVLWIPGCDHAGIATQVVVERHLWETKRQTRHELGREKFLMEVSKWKEEKSDIIYSQMKRLGVILDWDHSFFTLDENTSTGVNEALTRLFEEGFIYRGNYMINWCCGLQSAISDFEVEMLDLDGPTRLSVPGYEKPVTFGYMYELKYKLVDSDGTITVCTTRPETILGDTALMVHPDDHKYTKVHGKRVVHPFRGDTIPIITDKRVSKEVGSGVVKVTPGHSFQDYEVALKHDLPVIEIIDDKGLITGFSQFQDMPRFSARKAILDHLSSKGLYSGSRKPHSLKLPRCMRTGDVIEPRLKAQWFISMDKMMEDAVEVVEDSSLKFYPPDFSNIWKHFLSEKRDWCISRQLWWGHRMPIYWGSTRLDTLYGSTEEESKKESLFVSAKSEEEAKLKVAKSLGVHLDSIRHIERESDVLDTWFSSSLLPFVNFGWPKDTVELKQYFPLSLMETGHDILFFWVARMVMMSLKLTGQLPFKDVLLHGLVCDAKGQKMSKSKGNVIDPLDIMEGVPQEDLEKKKVEKPAFGADALRLTLCSLDLKKRNIALDARYIEQGLFFRNKMWQTIRFLIHNVQNIPDGHNCMECVRGKGLTHVMDKWLMSHLSQMVTDAHQGFCNYDIYIAAQGLRKFWTSHLCDVYLEAVKPRLWNYNSSSANAEDCLRVLWTCCHTGFLVLAPFMPFLTEELYQRIPSRNPKMDSIMQCQFPRPEEWDEYKDCKLEREMNEILESVSSLRSLRKMYNINSKFARGKGSIFFISDSTRETCEKIIPEIQRLSFLSEVSIASHNDFDSRKLEPGIVVHPVSPEVTVQLHLQGMINPEVESNRLSKKLQKLEKQREEFQERIDRFRAKEREPKENDISKVASLNEEIDKLVLLLNNVKNMVR